MAVHVHIDHLIGIVIEELVDLILTLDRQSGVGQEMVVTVVACVNRQFNQGHLNLHEIGPKDIDMMIDKINMGLFGYEIALMDLVSVDIDKDIIAGVVDHAKGRLGNGEVAVLHDEIGVLGHNVIILQQ